MLEPGSQIVTMDEQHHDRRRYDRHQRRVEARRPSAIERAHIDGVGVQFADQEGGDEISRQAEEHGDTDEAVDERPGRGVLAEDQKNRHTADAVQSGLVTTVAHDRFYAAEPSTVRTPRTR